MHVMLVGADLEENLGMGMVAAVARQHGHQVEVLPFNGPEQSEEVALEIATAAPEVVGLSVQFQHRAWDFVALAQRLRSHGFRGHITCGGQLPSMAHERLLADQACIDSVVLYEAEESFPALLQALERKLSLGDVHGIAFRNHQGAVVRTPSRCLIKELDDLPFAERYRQHSQHLGVPFIPIVGGRGCWGRCSFCSITSFFREAQSAGGGKRLRLRSPENIAQEMALLWHAAGGSGIFCFHDETLLLPRPEDTRKRLWALREELTKYGVGQLAMVGKCRPDSLDADLAKDLYDLGVLRLYVGVENVSAAGSENLARGMSVARVSESLDACRSAGIFTCYNLLLFEPQTTLDDVAANITFMRRHQDFPVNFCRAEPYFGTPLAKSLALQENLAGSYLGFDYRMQDDRAELLFRITAAAFRERNFAADGVHNRYMGLGYCATVLRQFHLDSGNDGRIGALGEQATELTSRIVCESADFLEEALELAREADLRDTDAIERRTADLALRIAGADRFHHVAIDQLLAEMEAVASSNAQQPLDATSRFAALRDVAAKLARGVALTSLLSAWGVAGCDDGPTVMDPVPADAGPREAGQKDGMVVDRLPPDMGADTMVVDPLPADMGPEIMVVDPAPRDVGPEIMVVDPPPQDAGAEIGPIGLWRETTPTRAHRSEDLPFSAPPRPTIELLGSDDQGVRVALQGVAEEATIRWQSDGVVDGEGRNVVWKPESDADQLRVGVRTAGGVAVVTLRATKV